MAASIRLVTALSATPIFTPPAISAKLHMRYIMHNAKDCQMPSNLSGAKRDLQRLASRATTVQIAADTGIHQSQVSRLLRGRFRRVSPNVRALLAYASKGRSKKAEPRAAQAARTAVIRGALRTWDATTEVARRRVSRLLPVYEIESGS